MHSKLKTLRLAFGLSQKQLAFNTEIPIGIIKQLELGRLPMNYVYLLKLADYFQVSTDSLIKFSEKITGISKQMQWDQQDLLRIYTSLDEISKGKLYARALALAEESEYIQKNA